MAGRTSSQAITEYAGIQVQKSALGVQIAVGWGTFRCSCNLMDYLDFSAKAQKASNKGGGKGGQTTTGYSYSATLILSICEGPIDGVSIVYVDSNIYTDGAKTALQQANLNMNTGAVGQSVWSYLTGAHPDHAIGYSGLAIVYQSNYPLTAGATPPNHSFEVKRLTSFGVSGSKDADPSLIVADFFQNSRTGVPSWTSGLLGPLTQYQNYCLAAGLLLSPVIDQQRSASDFMTEVLLATNSTCVWSEGMLKFIPYGDTALSGNGKTYTPNNTPIYSLNDDDYVVDSPGDPPLQVDIEDQSDAYNVIQLEYLDRTNQYNMAIALASDAANVAQYGMRRQDPTTSHVICDPGVAAIAAQLYLQRTLYIRAQYRFKVGWMFALLEPGDIIALTDMGLGLTDYPVRVTQIDQDEQYGLSLICEDYPVGVSHAPLFSMQNAVGFQANQTIDPGGVEANLLLWSGDISQASAWSVINASVVQNSATDQYGLTTACTLVPTTGAAGEHTVYQAVSAFAGLNYTYSCCIKAGAHAKVRIRMLDGPHTNGVVVDFDVSAGAVIASSIVGTSTLISATVSAGLVPGIWLLTVTANTPTGSTEVVAISVLDSGGNFSWTGDGSNAIYVSQQALRQGVVAGVYAATTTAPAGPYIFNPPSALSSSMEAWAAVAGGPNWGGCNVWTSIDGSSYQQVGAINGSARYGVATASFASGADPDTTDNLSVDLGQSAGELMGASQATADNGGTMCLIDGELIAYEAANLTNPGRYTLGTYIRRGYLKTPIAAHSAGAPFVRIDNALFQFPYLPANIGQTIYVKFQSFNAFGKAVVPLSDCIAYSFTPYPAGSDSPGGSAWTATGGVLTNAGQAVPAIMIAGASDNPSAQGVVFYFMIHGAGGWTSAGIHPNSTTTYNITSVAAGAAYDVGVAYQVNGIIGAITTIASNITVGVFGTVPVDGTVMFHSSTAGSGSYTFPTPYSLAHCDIIITGAAGGDWYGSVGGDPLSIFDYAGSGATTTKTGVSVAGGSVVSFTLGSKGARGHGAPSAVTATDGGGSSVSSPALTAPGGIHATAAGDGAGAAAGTGGSFNAAGVAGASGGNGSITIIART